MAASIYPVGADDFTVHAIITGAMVSAVSHVLYVVSDLDDAFGGVWQVSPASFLPRETLHGTPTTVLTWTVTMRRATPP